MVNFLNKPSNGDISKDPPDVLHRARLEAFRAQKKARSFWDAYTLYLFQ